MLEVFGYVVQAAGTRPCLGMTFFNSVFGLSFFTVHDADHGSRRFSTLDLRDTGFAVDWGRSATARDTPGGPPGLHGRQGRHSDRWGRAQSFGIPSWLPSASPGPRLFLSLALLVRHGSREPFYNRPASDWPPLQLNVPDEYLWASNWASGVWAGTLFHLGGTFAGGHLPPARGAPIQPSRWGARSVALMGGRRRLNGALGFREAQEASVGASV
jgi:hypothetical protein